jgi:hypothetical protein
MGGPNAGVEINYHVSIFGRGLGDFFFWIPQYYHPAGVVLCKIGGSTFQSEEG